MFAFKYWSDKNPSIKNLMHPTFPKLKDWDTLSDSEKDEIWDYIYQIFGFENSRRNISFNNSSDENQVLLHLTILSIIEFDKSNKYNRFCQNWVTTKEYDSALLDFWSIYKNQKGYIVFELLSYFAKNLIRYSQSKSKNIYRNKDENNSDFQKRLITAKYEIFDNKAWILNDTFEQYGVNIKLTRIGFIYRQPKIIEQQLVDPIIDALADNKFEKVNRDFLSALKDFRELKYSESLTKFIAGFEEYIQICIGDDSKKFSQGIDEGMKIGVFPSDEFTRKIFKNTDSILSEMRKKYGIAHSPDDIATQKDAQIVMNLIFVFIQHCS